MSDKDAPVLEMKVFQGPDGETVRMERPVERVRSRIGDGWQRLQDKLEEVGSMGPEAYAEKLHAEREMRWKARGSYVGEALADGLVSVKDAIQGYIDSGAAQRFALTREMGERLEQKKKKYWQGKVLDLEAKEITVEPRGAGR